MKQYASQHKDRSSRCLHIHNRPKVSRRLGTCNQPSRPCKGQGSVAARWRSLRADRCAGRDKTRGWCPRGIRIRREATKEFLPGLKGTQRLTHDMSPTDMMQPQVTYTCIRSSALLEALRRQMDPSGRQLEADTCHMWSKRSGQAFPAHHSPWCDFTTGWPNFPPVRAGAASAKHHRPLPLMRRGANRGPASTTERKWLWQPYLKSMAGLTPQPL